MTTAAARTAFNSVNTFLAEQEAKLKSLQQVALVLAKQKDEAKLNKNSKDIEATVKTIHLFQGKKAELLRLHPELLTNVSTPRLTEKLKGVLRFGASTPPVPVKEFEETGFELNSGSPRNSGHTVTDNDSSERTLLLKK